jgi:hypothetical protein
LAAKGAVWHALNATNHTQNFFCFFARVIPQPTWVRRRSPGTITPGFCCPGEGIIERSPREYGLLVHFSAGAIAYRLITCMDPPSIPAFSFSAFLLLSFYTFPHHSRPSPFPFPRPGLIRKHSFSIRLHTTSVLSNPPANSQRLFNWKLLCISANHTRPKERRALFLCSLRLSVRRFTWNRSGPVIAPPYLRSPLCLLPPSQHQLPPTVL